MDKQVDLIKDIFDKNGYKKTIDTSFKELGVSSISDDLDKEVSVEEFFKIYNELFYEIPQEGDTNSHEYLVKTFGAYINFEENLEEIEALREEIAQLRTDLLEEQVKNSKLELNE